METTSNTSTTAFQKALLEDPERIPAFRPSRGSVVVGSEDYTRLIAKGFTVVEVWNVWTCQSCGMNDTDRQPADWEVRHLGATSHYDRYGHEPVRPVPVMA